MFYSRALGPMLLAFLCLGGCSHLSYVERESTLDKMESVNGDPAQNGKHADRREALAEKEVLNRQIKAEKNKGLVVEVANYCYRLRRFEIKKASLFLANPVTATLILPANATKTIYLMPGFYDVRCWAGNELIWEKTYEVTSAPTYDEISRKEVHCVMGNIDDGRHGYHRY